MSETVASQQLSALLEPQNGETADATVILGNDNNLRTKHNSHDADTGIHFQSSILASRPAFGVLGRKWYTSDTNQLWYDTGAAWVSAAYAPLAAPAFTGGITVAGGAVITGNSSVAGTLGATGLITAGAGLVVVGTITLNGIAYTYPGSQGANTYLKCNGTSTLTWAALPFSLSDVSWVAMADSGSTSAPAGVSSLVPPSAVVFGAGITVTSPGGVPTFALTGGAAGVVFVEVYAIVANPSAAGQWDVYVNGTGSDTPRNHAPNIDIGQSGLLARTFLVKLAGGETFTIKVNNPDGVGRLIKAEIAVVRVS